MMRFADMKKQLFLLSFLVLVGTGPLFAQSYKTTAGMRLGTDWGISAQQRIDKRITVEGILQSSLQREEFMITVLGEHHQPFLGPRFNFYTGAGLHKGWITDSKEMGLKNPFGLDLIAGIEFTFARMNLSYDLKPAINLIGGERTVYFQTGVSIRYVIVKKPFLEGNNKKKRQRRRKKK